MDLLSSIMVFSCSLCWHLQVKRCHNETWEGAHARTTNYISYLLLGRKLISQNPSSSSCQFFQNLCFVDNKHPLNSTRKRVCQTQTMEDYRDQSPFQILGVGQQATDSEIRKAYYILAKRYHPDHMQNASEGEKFFYNKKFQAISCASEVLKNPSTREIFSSVSNLRDAWTHASRIIHGENMSGSRTDEETHTRHNEKHRRRRKKATRKQEKERRQEEKERRRNEERKRRAQKKKSRRQKAREQEKAVLLKQQQEIARQEAMSTYFQCSICGKSVLRFDYFRHHQPCFTSWTLRMPHL
ncbi:unnamed protein product [Orchesella dallaii]|uniref:J domain-containing protein n=1 Tax=Orchesella dallaii TaxID=48710 RepID=A0ABP1RT74_9HEXA